MVQTVEPIILVRMIVDAPLAALLRPKRSSVSASIDATSSRTPILGLGQRNRRTVRRHQWATGATGRPRDLDLPVPMEPRCAPEVGSNALRGNPR